MTDNRLGEEIKRWRKAKKMTQKRLAEGICSQSEISRLEKGEFYPGIDTLRSLSGRLDLPPSYFLEVLIHDDVEETERVKEKITDYSLHKDYQGLFKYIEEQLSREEAMHPELKSYLQVHLIFAIYHLKKYDYRYCITELFLLLEREEEMQSTDILRKLRIKNGIATILAENGDFGGAMEMLQEVLDEQLSFPEYDRMKITVLYNLGKLNFMQGFYRKSLKITDEAIELALKRRDMTLLGQLYYQKASAFEKLSYPLRNIQDAYCRALFYFEELGLNYYIQILSKNKSEYLVSKKC